MAAGLQRHKQTNVVLDPVMVATSGDRLLQAEAIETLRRRSDPARARDHAQSAEAAALLDSAVAENEAAMR